ncbi:HNH endonuclease [Rhodococcus pyridinivorans]|uniref:HNH endonuclease n=1 Tax=Rhodococcus pyridinivorans TaxID=103816 RepID=UPI002283A423|nr:HNH endonuclease [Rhodococcus pyridinivorans]WAL48268.1 HNH endonuclease [Rhodococcus pyridinivorans]
MPDRPPRMCARCRNTFTGPRCPCRKPWEGSQRSGKSTRAYRRYRDRYLEEHPLCEWPGCPVLAQVADHVENIASGGGMFGPLRSLCHDHHHEVTQEQARRGRRPRGPEPEP